MLNPQSDHLLKKLQQMEFEILCDVTDLCEKHNLEYYLLGGTLLGAVRHKGFIPWDDDVDIGLPRDAFEKFIEIAGRELNDRYYIHSGGTDPFYWLPFAKVKKRGTFFNQESLLSVDTNKGIFIDVYPLDNTPRQKSWENAIRSISVRLILAVALMRRNVRRPQNTIFKRFFLRILCEASRIASLRSLLSFQKYLMTFHRRSDSNYLINYGFILPVIKEGIEKSKYSPPLKLEFNGRFFSVPRDYDAILKHHYGNYFVLPPESKRKTHRPVEIDFGEISEDAFPGK